MTKNDIVNNTRLLDNLAACLVDDTLDQRDSIFNTEPPDNYRDVIARLHGKPLSVEHQQAVWEAAVERANVYLTYKGKMK